MSILLKVRLDNKLSKVIAVEFWTYSLGTAAYLILTSSIMWFSAINETIKKMMKILTYKIGKCMNRFQFDCSNKFIVCISVEDVTNYIKFAKCTILAVWNRHQNGIWARSTRVSCFLNCFSNIQLRHVTLTIVILLIVGRFILFIHSILSIPTTSTSLFVMFIRGHRRRYTYDSRLLKNWRDEYYSDRSPKNHFCFGIR